jgi:uncharacterized protein (TIGR00369 family)
MKKILNPYTKIKGYNCFGCSPTNESGLRMSFFEDGEYTICKWQPPQHFNGYKNVLHGGIQATLADEIGSWFVTTRFGKACVTLKLEIKYLKPVFSDKGEITLKSRLLEIKRNIIFVAVELFDNENILCSEATISFFTFSDEVSREKYYFPGIDKFYEPST